MIPLTTNNKKEKRQFQKLFTNEAERIHAKLFATLPRFVQTPDPNPSFKELINTTYTVSVIDKMAIFYLQAHPDTPFDSHWAEEPKYTETKQKPRQSAWLTHS